MVGVRRGLIVPRVVALEVVAMGVRVARPRVAADAAVAVGMANVASVVAVAMLTVLAVLRMVRVVGVVR